MKIGDHILVDGKSPATICYIGLVDGHPGQWIGIEWWHQEGKHNGTYNDKFYFQTKHQLTGSFIRQERIQYGNSFTQAICRQYVKSFSNENITDDINYSLFGKQYSDYVVDLSSIIRIDLSSQWVNEFDNNADIYNNLHQIKELNIRQNLLKNWSELWVILEKNFPQLEILNVSNSRMNFDKSSALNTYIHITQLVVIDTDNDCDVFENLCKHFPNLINIHLDLNRLSFISENFINQIQNLTNLSLSDNPTLKSWDPYVNRLGKLKYLEELILNNCGIEEIKFPQENQTIELFPSLKYLYMSDNNISSYTSINELTCLSSLISFSILRNPIYPLNQIECETAKQMILARLPNLTHLNRVFISRDERRGAEIDYLQRYAQEYFENKLDFLNEHKQYKKLIEKHGEPLKSNINETSKKGLNIRSKLLKVIFELGDENERKIEKQIPPSTTIAKLKTLVRRLYSSQLTNDIQINLFVLIDQNHRELMSNDYQDIDFYLGNHCLSQTNDRPSIIRIETIT
ncbi:unnamed protein product [Adineta steineri]|uniref:Tubulin-specific chaperone E n=1 Tax=Adineta steineri TaxID=433720 RepID=A0A819FCK7_9BILA|nr:unnamed protein product [Adineta steineri]